MMLSTAFPVLICWGKDYTQLYNDNFKPILGELKHPQALGCSASQTFAEIWPSTGPMFDQVMAGSTLSYNDFKVELNRNGYPEDCYFDFSYSPIRDEEGNIGGVLVICLETTNKINASADKLIAMKAVAENEEKSAKLAAIVESSDDAILSKTLESVITSWNASAERMFGYTADEVIGQTIYKLIPIDRHDEEPRILSRLKKGERVEHFETKRMTKAGNLLDVSLTISPVKDRQGNIIGVSKIIRDITEKKQDELRKNDFIGMVSHELKTPLTSLTAILQVLNLKLRNDNDLFIAGAIDKANLQVKKMIGMINGFLNISRLESGKISIDKQVFNLEGLIAEVISEAELTITRHRIIFEPCGGFDVFADRDKIASVISNLISNAIKYSPKGHLIEVKCEMLPDDIQVSVRDEGIGIEPEHLDKLFERYYRVKTSAHQISGFGIGLYLSAEIVERTAAGYGLQANRAKAPRFILHSPGNRPVCFGALLQAQCMVNILNTFFVKNDAKQHLIKQL